MPFLVKIDTEPVIVPAGSEPHGYPKSAFRPIARFPRCWTSQRNMIAKLTSYIIILQLKPPSKDPCSYPVLFAIVMKDLEVFTGRHAGTS